MFLLGESEIYFWKLLIELSFFSSSNFFGFGFFVQNKVLVNFLLLFFLFHLSSSSSFPECIPQAFSIPLSQVIANDRTHRQRQDGYRQDPPQREEHKDSSDLVSSILQVC